MAKITRIKANDSPSREESDEPKITRKKVILEDKKTAKAKREARRQIEKQLDQDAKENKKVFILFRPFVALFRYLRNSWREIRQVRWPNRKLTWKMVLAVFIYTILFIALISLLDVFLTWLFNIILGKG